MGIDWDASLNAEETGEMGTAVQSIQACAKNISIRMPEYHESTDSLNADAHGNRKARTTTKLLPTSSPKEAPFAKREVIADTIEQEKAQHLPLWALFFRAEQAVI